KKFPVRLARQASREEFAAELGAPALLPTLALPRSRSASLRGSPPRGSRAQAERPSPDVTQSCVDPHCFLRLRSGAGSLCWWTRRRRTRGAPGGYRVIAVPRLLGILFGPAAITTACHWLTVEWLPKYAPELNNIEIVWRDLKAHHLAHQTFADSDGAMG